MVYVNDSWTLERIEKLKEWWASGEACSAIAKVISAMPGPPVSRNAVIGKVHRMGLPGRVQAAAPKQGGISKPTRSIFANRTSGQSAKAKAAFNPQAKAFPGSKHATAISARQAPDIEVEADDLPPSPPVAVSGNARRLGDFENNRSQCRWPINDPGIGRMDETLFCADPVDAAVEGCPYCAHHRVRGVAPVSYQPRGGAKALEKALRWYAAA